MAIPDSLRVSYEVNLLENVNCTLRFPPLLVIGGDPPIAFHERIREFFPFYKLTSEVKFRASVNPSGGLIIPPTYRFQVL